MFNKPAATPAAPTPCARRYYAAATMQALIAKWDTDPEKSRNVIAHKANLIALAMVEAEEVQHGR